MAWFQKKTFGGHPHASHFTHGVHSSGASRLLETATLGEGYAAHRGGLFRKNTVGAKLAHNKRSAGW